MRRTENVLHVVIVGRSLIGVSHDESDGAARRLAFKHSAQYFNLVGLLPRCCYGALSRFSSVKLALYEIKVDVYSCRVSVYNSADSLAVLSPKVSV